MPPEASELPDTPRQRREEMKHIVPLFLFFNYTLSISSKCICGILKIQIYKTPEVFSLGKHNEVV